MHVPTILTVALWLLLGYLGFKALYHYIYWRLRVPVRVKPYTYILVSPWVYNTVFKDREFTDNDLIGHKLIDTTICSRDERAELARCLFRRKMPFKLEWRGIGRRFRLYYDTETISLQSYSTTPVPDPGYAIDAVWNKQDEMYDVLEWSLLKYSTQIDIAFPPLNK